ncbi:hypothetical protein MHU86_12900 [Fragilaria crotonensis]|nr:hypothetical protein MHU86_12900 [Fragilaria crotonensis]
MRYVLIVLLFRWMNAEASGLRNDFVSRMLAGEQTACVPGITPPGCTADPRPKCTPYRSVDYCPVNESFQSYIQKRTSFVRNNLQDLMDEGIWFHNLEDKLAGYKVAASLGLNPPKIHFCTNNVSELLDFNKTAAGMQGFVVRATDLHSNYGIYALPNGFNGKEFIRGVDMTAQDVVLDLTALGAKTVIIEDYVGSEVSLPVEVKFHMFNGQVGSINVVTNRGTECACWAEMDEKQNRLDQFGCFSAGGRAEFQGQCTAIDFQKGATMAHPMKGLDLCTDLVKFDDCLMNDMIAIARQASEMIGVYIRVDMFVGNDGKIYLQEFTTNHMNGLRHCSAIMNANGCVDPCFQGAMWKAAGNNSTFGGSLTVEPEALTTWLSLPIDAKCPDIEKTQLQPAPLSTCSRNIQDGNSTAYPITTSPSPSSSPSVATVISSLKPTASPTSLPTEPPQPLPTTAPTTQSPTVAAQTYSCSLSSAASEFSVISEDNAIINAQNLNGLGFLIGGNLERTNSNVGNINTKSFVAGTRSGAWNWNPNPVLAGPFNTLVDFEQLRYISRNAVSSTAADGSRVIVINSGGTFTSAAQLSSQIDHNTQNVLVVFNTDLDVTLDFGMNTINFSVLAPRSKLTVIVDQRDIRGFLVGKEVSVSSTANISSQLYTGQPECSSDPAATGLPIPTSTPTPAPTFAGSEQPSNAASVTPTVSSSQSSSILKSKSPSSLNSELPTVMLSEKPSTAASFKPSQMTSQAPSSLNSELPTVTLSEKPSNAASLMPTITTSRSPSALTSEAPSRLTSTVPTVDQSEKPSNAASLMPTVVSSQRPSVGLRTESPSLHPSELPTVVASERPSSFASVPVTPLPTPSPTEAPTAPPTVALTTDPTVTQTESPTASPTEGPTGDPTSAPTESPTGPPTVPPTGGPTADPSVGPTGDPTAAPTEFPTGPPTAPPTGGPTADPTVHPTEAPTTSPTAFPTGPPTPLSTSAPATPSPTVAAQSYSCILPSVVSEFSVISEGNAIINAQNFNGLGLLIGGNLDRTNNNAGNIYQKSFVAGTRSGAWNWNPNPVLAGPFNTLVDFEQLRYISRNAVSSTAADGSRVIVINSGGTFTSAAQLSSDLKPWIDRYLVIFNTDLDVTLDFGTNGINFSALAPRSKLSVNVNSGDVRGFLAAREVVVSSTTNMVWQSYQYAGQPLCPTITGPPVPTSAPTPAPHQQRYQQHPPSRRVRLHIA